MKILYNKTATKVYLQAFKLKFTHTHTHTHKFKQEKKPS